MSSWGALTHGGTSCQRADAWNRSGTSHNSCKSKSFCPGVVWLLLCTGARRKAMIQSRLLRRTLNAIRPRSNNASGLPPQDLDRHLTRGDDALPGAWGDTSEIGRPLRARRRPRTATGSENRGGSRPDGRPTRSPYAGGEPLDSLARGLGVTAPTLVMWREQFLARSEAALKSRPVDERTTISSGGAARSAARISRTSYNREWLCDRHGHQTPAAVRAQGRPHMSRSRHKTEPYNGARSDDLARGRCLTISTEAGPTRLPSTRRPSTRGRFSGGVST